MNKDFALSLHQEHSSGIPISTLAKKHSIHRDTIRRAFKKHNLKTVSKQELYLKRYDDVVNYYKSGLSIRDISLVTRIPLSQVLRLLNTDSHITVKTVFDYRKKLRKYSIDESMFRNIDTVNKAYFLGFLYADGNVHSRYYQVKLKLQKKDKQILEDIKSAFGFQQNLLESLGDYKRQDQSILVISNKVIHSDLIRHGVRPNKTFKLSFPFWLDKELYSHFVRGYFDGDGCISYDKKRGATTMSICGTEHMCDDLKIVFREHLGIRSSVSTDRNIFRVRVRRYKDVEAFQHWIYHEADLKLDRKYHKFLEINRIKNDSYVQ